MKKIFILVILAAVVSSSVVAFDDSSFLPFYTGFGSSAEELSAGPTVIDVKTTSIVLQWFTISPSFSYIEFGTNPDPSTFKIYEKQRYGLKEGYSALHRAFLDGLDPDTIYYYRIKTTPVKSFDWIVTFSLQQFSKIYSFKTVSETEKTFEFGVLNDIHDNKKNYTAFVGQLTKKDNCGALFLNGDIMDIVRTPGQIVESVFKPAGDFSKSKPVYPLRGNHETRGPSARILSDFYYTPEGNFYRLICRGPAAILMIDGGEDKPDNHKEYYGLVDFKSYREQETAWLIKTLGSDEWKNASVKIVIGHVPVMHVDSQVDYEKSYPWQDEWTEMFNKSGVDLMISGHTHQYEIELPQQSGNAYPIVIGGGRKVEDSTLLYFTVNSNNIQLQVLSSDGKQLDVKEFSVR